jgi:hypothetical protein
MRSSALRQQRMTFPSILKGRSDLVASCGKRGPRAFIISVIRRKSIRYRTHFIRGPKDTFPSQDQPPSAAAAPAAPAVLSMCSFHSPQRVAPLPWLPHPNSAFHETPRKHTSFCLHMPSRFCYMVPRRCKTRNERKESRYQISVHTRITPRVLSSS